MRSSKTRARTGKKKPGAPSAQESRQKKIETPSIEAIPGIEFDFDGSSGLGKRMNSRITSILCTLEWSWSPINERKETYYLQDSRKYWTLWIERFDDNYGQLEKPIAIARCPRQNFGGDYKVAGINLLAAVLTEETRRYDSELDRFHAISKPGLLSTKELDVVADTVWGTISAT
jgi:hypothetical protein